MAVYSYSKLGSFQQCPLKYKFAYIDHIPSIKKGIEAFTGSCVHKTLELLYKEIKFKILTLEELFDFFEKYWAKGYSDKVTITRKDRTVEDYKTFGRKCIENYYKSYHPFNQSKVLGIETRLQLDLDGTGKYQMQGYIDRIDQVPDGSYEIHDYKTNGTLPGQDEMDEDIQLPLYQIGVMKLWNDVKKVKLIWHYVAFDKDIVSYRTMEQLEELKKHYIGLIQQVESTNEFLPQESRLCDWCDYQEHCPCKKHLFKVSALPGNEYLNDDGVKLVDAYAKIEGQKAELKDKIKLLDEDLEKIAEAAIKYGEKEGIEAIVGSQNQLKIKETAYASMPKEEDKYAELEAILQETGKLDEVCSINSGSLKKLLSEKQIEPTVADKIKALVGFHIDKKVSMSKLKEDKEE